MSQQLSVKVAETLRNRFLLLFDTSAPKAHQVASLPFEKLKGIGLSHAKAQYILNVADFFVSEKNASRKLLAMNNDEVITYLTQIKGVGRWTVEMLLMFSMARQDVFPADDYGIQSAMKKLYGLDDSNKKLFKQQLKQISDHWHPYQTYACMYLWKWKDAGQ